MAWTTPITWAGVSTALSNTRLNEQLRDNMQYLYDAWAASGWGWNYVRNGHFDAWSAGAAAAPDVWTLAGTSAAVAREASTIKVGTYSAKVTSALNYTASLSQSLPADLVKQLRGRYITLAAWVYASAASRVFIRLTDGTTTTDSAYHTGGGAFERLTVTLGATVAAGATTITFSLQMATGSSQIAYIDGVTLNCGPLPSAFTNGFNDWSPRWLLRQDAAGNAYRMSGGLLLQYGVSGSASGNVTVTYPQAFSAAPYLVLLTDNYRNGRSAESIGVSTFVAYRASGSSSSGVLWIAVGPE